jgi:hypothetical protein
MLRVGLIPSGCSCDSIVLNIYAQTENECNAVIVFLDIICCPVFYLKHFGGWVMPLPSGKNFVLYKKQKDE